MNIQEITQTKDLINLLPTLLLNEKGGWKGVFSLNKFDFSQLSEQARALAEKEHETKSLDYMKTTYRDCFISDEVIGENLLLNSGINVLTNLLAGGGGTAFSSGNARIGVGDSSTAAAASQTGLQASSNKTYQAMDGSYPTYGTSQIITFRATFASGSANYSWQEFTVDNGTTSLNRLVSNQGTKTSGQSWQITVTITIS